MAKRTKGFCKYCGKEYTKAGMVKHLLTCKEREIARNAGPAKIGYYELVLYGKYVKDYWLIIQITEEATLMDLDQFIRNIWVECCEHLSGFQINGERYESMTAKTFIWEKPAKSMNRKLNKIFEIGMKIEYEYDYGSTTELIIDVQDYYKAPKPKEKVTILSRNNPPQICCSQCEENIASWIDPEGYYEGTPFWCDKCLEKTKVKFGSEPEFLLPVCNSPRMGVCGYEGSHHYPEQFESDKKE